jgi:hypothetical protein
MTISKSSLPLVVITIWVFAFWGLHSSAQSVQPGNPTRTGLPPQDTAAGTVDSPLATVHSPALPSGWGIREDGNGCQWAVPGGWYFVQHNVDALRYGGGSGKAFLQGIGFTGDWDQYKTQEKQQFHATKILEDSSDRLWLQYSKSDGGLHYFVATVGTGFMCTAHIDVSNKAELKNLTPVADHMATRVRPSTQ